MSQVFFWTMLVLISYVYLGYPALLKSIVLWDRRDAKQCALDSFPKVSLLISAYNEERCIRSKLDNSLQLDYPSDKLEVIVISDASEDDTDQIVQGYQNHGVRLIRLDSRKGKTAGLNSGVDQAAGEIIVFSDANALYERDAIRALVRPFVERAVGAVVGESRYRETDSDSGQSESLYWRYEKAIKRWESATGSVVGGDGAIYALRRPLYSPMSDDALSDFVNPLHVVKAGYRCVYEPDAVSYEDAATSFYREYRRKVRIVNRAALAMWRMKELLNPFRYGFFALKLWSHKVLRWVMPFFLVGLFLSNLPLLKVSVIYNSIFVIQSAFYSLALLGFFVRQLMAKCPICRVSFYFCLVNFASAVGLVEAALGKTYATWTTARAGR